MLRPLLICVALILISSACSASSADTHENDVVDLKASLNEARNFWLHFFSVTGEYSLSPSELKEKSSVKIYRSCGANCANTLDVLVQHLQNAQPIICISGPGMENVLLELSTGKQVVYSHAGRQIKINGSCYLSEVSINKVLDRTDYIFK